MGRLLRSISEENVFFTSSTTNLIDGILVAFLYRHPKVYFHENFSVYP